MSDSKMARDATDLVRDVATDLVFDHSRRVFLFGSLRGQEQRLSYDPELLYIGAMFHDLGLTDKYRRTDQRFEIDAADVARSFLSEYGIDVVQAHPRPDFKNQILAAFANRLKDRPDTTFGNIKADVLQHFLPGFQRGDFVEVIRGNAWSE